MDVRIIHGTRACFDPILTVMVACNAIVSATQYLYRIRSDVTLPSSATIAQVEPSLPMDLPALISSTVLKFDPSSLLQELSLNRKPSQIQFSEEIISASTALIPEGAVEMPDLSLIRKWLIQAIFTDFYETQKCTIDSKYNSLQQWSEIWKFAWVVRNAFALGGNISWSDPRIQSVSWKNTTYDRSHDNGRDFIFKDIGDGDLIILIDELDQDLSRV